VIVRWGLDTLAPVLEEVGSSRPLVVASERWSELELPFEPARRWTEVPSDRIDEAAAAAKEADAVVAIGGGSAIDLGKAISAATGLALVSVPTTYAGAEWTPYFGVRDPGRRMRGGGSGAHLAAIVYDVDLVGSPPLEVTVGTAMNALAHCAEALYVKGRNDDADAHALEGARLIGEFLPRVVEAPEDRELREGLLRGACEAGQALGGSMLALGHAIAQALGGRYGLPHGALNAICLPAALRFNEPVAPDALRRLGAAFGTDDPIGRVEELARLSGFERLRDLGVPEEELDEVAEAVVARAGAKANPRPASPEQIAELLRSIW
jgi:maleylacetate reductase